MRSGTKCTLKECTLRYSLIIMMMIVLIMMIIIIKIMIIIMIMKMIIVIITRWGRAGPSSALVWVEL